MTTLDDRFDDTVTTLTEHDSDLAAVIERWGRPAFWSRPATFATLVLLVLEQQVSLASGKATFDRLRDLTGEMTPERLSALDEPTVRSAGVTRQKTGYLLGLAHGVLDGSIDWPAITTGDRDETRAAVLAVRGLGPWTTDVWLLACRCLPDEWPIGDRALQVGCAEVLAAPDPLVGDDLVTAGERWAPHRSTAARLIWHHYLAVRGRAETVVEGLG